MGSPPAVTWAAQDTDVATIERQLSYLWSEATGGKSSQGGVRTTVYNLVVAAHDDEAALRVSNQLATLSQRRPSRALIIIPDRYHSTPGIDASLSLQCHGAEAGRSLCHEQMIVRVKGRGADHLASLVIPLLMPELPTYLWWDGQPPFGYRVFHRMLSISQQLVIDSADFMSPGDGLANVARISATQHGVNDFNWGRHAAWRELVSQFFDAPDYCPYVSGFRSVRMEFGSGGNGSKPATASILLMLGWMGSQLQWKPETTLDGVVARDVTLAVTQGERLIPIDIQFRDHGPEARGHLCGLDLMSEPPGLSPAKFTIRRMDGDQHAEVTVAVDDANEITRTVPLEVRSDAELLGDELDLGGHDPVYDHVVDIASRMAGREVWLPR